MSDIVDIRHLLEAWPYDPDDDARIIQSDDGRELLQVRTPLGIEQLEMKGRPDGLRPHGKESALEYQLQQLAKAKAAGREPDFELEPGDCAELFGEGTIYYFRYLRLFQLRRWAETVRDTARNLKLFDFVHEHAQRDDDRNHLEKWRPYILRMNAAASALLAAEKGAHDKGLEILGSAIARIESLDEMDDETFKFERNRSLVALHELSGQIQQTRPVSPVERLEQQLRQAIDKQEFERAAALRDRIRELKAHQPVK